MPDKYEKILSFGADAFYYLFCSYFFEIPVNNKISYIALL